jgi:two-component system KDP operon response regulator KdpE
MSDVLILLVEDERRVRNFIRATLISQQYRYLEAANGAEAISAVENQKPDLVLLDLGLPDMDGIEVIKNLREDSMIPIIVLSARGQEVDKTTALDLGADDYLVKPFGGGELLARIRVALRHTAFVSHSISNGSSCYHLGELMIDLENRRVSRGTEEIYMTPTEFRLLTIMARHPGKVLTHSYMVKEIWGPFASNDAQSVRVHMASIRRKLERDPSSPTLFLTEVGIGYRMADEPWEESKDDEQVTAIR